MSGDVTLQDLIDGIEQAAVYAEAQGASLSSIAVDENLWWIAVSSTDERIQRFTGTDRIAYHGVAITKINE